MRANRVLSYSLLLATSLVVSSCQKSDTKILIGATARISSQGPEIQDSVVVIAGGKIKLVAQRKDAPIPQDSERSNLAGKWIVPSSGSRLEANQPANLLVLNSNNPSDIARRMQDGEWQAR